MSKTWSATFGVHTYELDRQQRVSLRAVCSYLIDTAGQHASQVHIPLDHWPVFAACRA